MLTRHLHYSHTFVVGFFFAAAIPESVATMPPVLLSALSTTSCPSCCWVCNVRSVLVSVSFVLLHRTRAKLVNAKQSNKICKEHTSQKFTNNRRQVKHE